jgi:hypothetical protein
MPAAVSCLSKQELKHLPFPQSPTHSGWSLFQALLTLHTSTGPYKLPYTTSRDRSSAGRQAAPPVASSRGEKCRAYPSIFFALQWHRGMKERYVCGLQVRDRLQRIAWCGIQDTPGMAAEQKRLVIAGMSSFLLLTICLPTFLALVLGNRTEQACAMDGIVDMERMGIQGMGRV